ncbi:MAG: hypothetical protein OES47_04930 [Acidobacteriota bacterium]|nr:hypothetical protein [Acidobacteriota bacterium]
MRKRALFSRREILSAVGLGAAVLALPRVGTAGSLVPLPTVPGESVDIPGGAELARAALDRYRSVALFQRARPVGEGSVRLDLGGEMNLEIETRSSGHRSIVVEAPQGALELECSRSRGVHRVVAQLTEDFATGHPSGFDTIRSTHDGVELTFSDDLALRYATPMGVAKARHPAVYDELADRVIGHALEPVK